MKVREMTSGESFDFLARSRFGRLGCVRDNHPYIVPISFVCDQGRIYGFSTAGQKTDWMRANPHVCLQADRVISARRWTSVVLFGRYQELPDTPERHVERQRAWGLFQQTPDWWEPAYMRPVDGVAERPLESIWYTIEIEKITGHSAGEPLPPANLSAHGRNRDAGGWLDQFLHRN
jgi:nitroimidazol reductase NimA-like FMN-containing flavoprotein (pyridoxamine 5'-phosphate oxidase superfamily)